MIFIINILIYSHKVLKFTDWSKISTIKPTISNNLDLLVKNNLHNFRINFNDKHQLSQIEQLVQKIRLLEQPENNYNKIYNNNIFFELPKNQLTLDNIDNLYLSSGDKFYLDLFEQHGSYNRAYFTELEKYHTYFHLNDIIYLNDGQVKLKIIEKSYSFLKNCPYLLTEVLTDGTIFSGCSIQIPNLVLDELIISDGSQAIIKLAQKLQVDYLILPGVKNINQLLNFKIKYLSDINDFNLKIITKIEHAVTLDYIEEVVKNSDSIMLNRKSLEIELGIKRFNELKKGIVEFCHSKNTKVILDHQTINFL